MNRRQHSHGLVMKIFKILFSVGSLVFLVRILLLLLAFVFGGDRSLIDLIKVLVSVIFAAAFTVSAFLIAAYYFPDIDTDEEGLLVEFLWKRIRVSWDDVIELKPVFMYGIPSFGRPVPVVVLTEKLTPFHRVYGLLYGFSTKPAFVIQPGVSEFELLKNDIEKHIKKNRRSKK
jgi:hypothetical protein